MKIRKIIPLLSVATLLAVNLPATAQAKSASVVASAYKDPLETTAKQSAGTLKGLFLDIILAGERLVAVGERGHIVYSDNAGQDWQQANVPVSTHLNAVYFVNDQLGWAVGEDAVILHTRDGGSNWTRQFDDRNADIKGPLLDVLFLDQHRGFAVGVYGKLFVTSDGGKTWLQDNERLDNLDEWHLNAIAALQPKNGKEAELYIAGEAGTAYRSLDGGTSWENLELPAEASFMGVAVSSGKNASRVSLFGVAGNLLISHDQGNAWTTIDTGVNKSLTGGTYLNSGELLLAVADGQIFKLDGNEKNKTLQATDARLPLSTLLPYKSNVYTVGIAGIAVFDSSLENVK